MQIKFENKAKESFYLGQVSFNVLDRNDIFDKYQQCEEYRSDVILAVKKEDTANLAKDVLNAIKEQQKKAIALGKTFRPDIAQKLENFSNFVKNSNGFQSFMT